MNVQQNSTSPKKSTDLIQLESDPRYLALIDFKAMNGLMTDEEGSMVKQSMQWLADLLKVDRGTLYNWTRRDGFWDRVNDRRKEVSPKARLAKVHETFYLKAVAGEWQFTNAYLTNYDPNYRPPTQKVEHEAGDSLVEAITAARNRRNVIEAEVVDESTSQA